MKYVTKVLKQSVNWQKIDCFNIWSGKTATHLIITALQMSGFVHFFSILYQIGFFFLKRDKKQADFLVHLKQNVLHADFISIDLFLCPQGPEQ